MKLDTVKLSVPAQTKWVHNSLVFLKPVIVLYIVAVVGIIGMNGGVVKLTDFIPNPFMLGGATLYVLNSCLDYLNKMGV